MMLSSFMIWQNTRHSLNQTDNLVPEHNPVIPTSLNMQEKNIKEAMLSSQR